VIFKEDLSGKDFEKCKEFLALVEKTGMIAKVFKSPTNDKRILLKLKATQAWYDEKATQLDYLYEMKPIVCDIPEDEETQEIVKAKLAREKMETPMIEKMYEPFDKDEKELFMFNGYHNMYTSFRGAMIEYFLRERRNEGGCALAEYKKSGLIVNYFPIHEADRVTCFKATGFYRCLGTKPPSMKFETTSVKRSLSILLGLLTLRIGSLLLVSWGSSLPSIWSVAKSKKSIARSLALSLEYS